MSEKVIPFVPVEGESSRIERQWNAADFESDAEVEFDFRSIDELSVESLVVRWNELIQSLSPFHISADTTVSDYDGVAAFDDAPPEQVRQSLIYHYKQIHDERELIQDRLHYWQTHPEIRLYLDHVASQKK